MQIEAEATKCAESYQRNPVANLPFDPAGLVKFFTQLMQAFALCAPFLAKQSGKTPVEFLAAHHYMGSDDYDQDLLRHSRHRTWRVGHRNGANLTPAQCDDANRHLFDHVDGMEDEHIAACCAEAAGTEDAE